MKEIYCKGAKDAKEILNFWYLTKEITLTPSRPSRLRGSKVLVRACPG
jgi:hypothetical protein